MHPSSLSCLHRFSIRHPHRNAFYRDYGHSSPGTEYVSCIQTSIAAEAVNFSNNAYLWDFRNYYELSNFWIFYKLQKIVMQKKY